MLKLLIAIALTFTIVSAKNHHGHHGHNGHHGHKNHKSYNHGSKHTNNTRNHNRHGDSILNEGKNRIQDNVEREIGRQVLKSIL